MCDTQHRMQWKMPSKKKKYNARFPPARIKKMMQADEEVGKVAAVVPVMICELHLNLTPICLFDSDELNLFVYSQDFGNFRRISPQKGQSGDTSTKCTNSDSCSSEG